jgi:peptidoglycan/xylan/chitin deacetylase (PgdA/CDA1 family)
MFKRFRFTTTALAAVALTCGALLMSTVAASGATTAKPVKPVNTALPTISGTAQQGQTLTASTGSWSGSPTSYAYQWRRCKTACSDISAATAPTYAAVAADVGSTLRIVVTATNSGGSTAATSDPTATVAAAVPAPKNTALPTISGTAQQGQMLTASTGNWSGSPTSYAYQWSRCNINGKGCATIASASSQTYVVAAGDIGFTMRVAVTATNDGGSSSSTSNQTSLVTAAPVIAPANSTPPTISGLAQEGQTLTASDGSWSGSAPTYSYQWRSCNTAGNSCSSIAGATDATYTAVNADIGTTLRVVVTATNSAGSASATSDQTATVQAGVHPINNDCSAGTVAFTFDDGPDTYTPDVMAKLMALNIHATFFVLGQKAQASPQMISAEVANGFSVQNHTYDHASFTGTSTGTDPLTDAQIQAELDSTSDVIVAAGAPRPTLYRPPYGDINSYDDLFARNLGYRIVMPWGTPTGNIVDSRDWTGISSSQIASNVVNGYSVNGLFYPGIRADSIVAMHDGESTGGTTAQALQAIVDYMNANHLCSASSIRPDATGGVVPAPASPEPTSGNLVQNASLETLPTTNLTPASEPVCFQQAGANVASNVASWSLTSDAHSGSVAEQVNVTSWSGGDRKLVLTQRQSQASCLAAVTPGKTYSMWVWYKGSWAYSGANPTKVSIATYYRNSAGTWVFWQASPLMPPTASWNLANFTSAPLPAGATAVSFGLAISGVGNLTTDDYAMVMNN